MLVEVFMVLGKKKAHLLLQTIEMEKSTFLTPHVPRFSMTALSSS